MNTKQLPIKNRRPVEPRACATCHYGEYDNEGGYVCKRDGFNFETGLGEHWMQICDNYRRRKERQEGSSRR